MVKTKKGDFIEIDFIARVKDGGVFDTTIESEAKEAGLLKEGEKRKFEPFKLCLGEEMILHGLDLQLTGKEPEKEYEVELKPQEAFGKRNPKLIKIISLGGFLKKGMNPVPGTFVNINDMAAKIMSVSGGRVVVDFNNPLADKIVVYKVKIKRVIKDKKEKIDALAKFYFKDYEIKEEETKDKESKDKEGKDKEVKERKFSLVVKAKKLDLIEKNIKKLFPSLEISYQS
jgi:peptidylprolyl isomerase